MTKSTLVDLVAVYGHLQWSLLIALAQSGSFLVQSSRYLIRSNPNLICEYSLIRGFTSL